MIEMDEYTPFICMATVEPKPDDLKWGKLSTIATAYHCQRSLLAWSEKPYIGWPCNVLACWALGHFHSSVVYSPQGLFPVYLR